MVLPDEARALPDERVRVHPVVVDRPHDELPAELLREDVVVDEPRAAVGVAALAALDPDVTVIPDRLDVPVDVRIEMLPPLAVVPRPLDDVPEVRDDARLGEELPVVVEVHPPRVAGAPGEDLELLLRGVVPPVGAVQRNPLPPGRARLPDPGVGEHPVAAVEPSVRPPDEAVERLVLVMAPPPVEHDLRFAVRHVVAVPVGNEEQVRRLAHPHPAEPDLEAAHEAQLVVKDLSRVVLPVAVGVLEDEDRVPPGRLERTAWAFVAEVLRHPDPAAVVDAHRIRLADGGFARERRDGEPLGHRHLPGGHVGGNAVPGRGPVELVLGGARRGESEDPEYGDDVSHRISLPAPGYRIVPADALRNCAIRLRYFTTPGHEGSHSRMRTCLSVPDWIFPDLSAPPAFIAPFPLTHAFPIPFPVAPQASPEPRRPHREDDGNQHQDDEEQQDDDDACHDGRSLTLPKAATALP